MASASSELSSNGPRDSAPPPSSFHSTVDMLTALECALPFPRRFISCNAFVQQPRLRQGYFGSSPLPPRNPPSINAASRYMQERNRGLELMASGRTHGGLIVESRTIISPSQISIIASVRFLRPTARRQSCAIHCFCDALPQFLCKRSRFTRVANIVCRPNVLCQKPMHQLAGYSEWRSHRRRSAGPLRT